MVRRVLAGAEAQPRWMPRWVLTVVSADVDTAAGVAAVWFLWRPKCAWASEHTAVLEWHDEQWQYVGGGGSSPVDDPADEEFDVDVLEIGGEGGTVSLTRRMDAPDPLATAPWIGYAVVHLGPDVAHLLVGDRRIDAPGQRKLIAAWMCPATARRARPVIVALGRDGTELSRIGPHDTLDTHTWAQLGEE
ncbi:hypothetical protein ACWCO0_09320 [Streptomyces tubercidicus]